MANYQNPKPRADVNCRFSMDYLKVKLPTILKQVFCIAFCETSNNYKVALVVINYDVTLLVAKIDMVIFIF